MNNGGGRYLQYQCLHYGYWCVNLYSVIVFIITTGGDTITLLVFTLPLLVVGDAFTLLVFTLPLIVVGMPLHC